MIKEVCFLFVEEIKLSSNDTLIRGMALVLLGTVVGFWSESQTLNRYKSLLRILLEDKDTARKFYKTKK